MVFYIDRVVWDFGNRYIVVWFVCDVSSEIVNKKKFIMFFYIVGNFNLFGNDEN